MLFSDVSDELSSFFSEFKWVFLRENPLRETWEKQKTKIGVIVIIMFPIHNCLNVWNLNRCEEKVILQLQIV